MTRKKKLLLSLAVVIFFAVIINAAFYASIHGFPVPPKSVEIENLQSEQNAVSFDITASCQSRFWQGIKGYTVDMTFTFI